MKTFFVAAAILWAALGGTLVPGAAANPFESDTPPKPKGRIDELVFAKLQKMGAQPANLCSDGVFIRRAYLDVIGTLPTGKEAYEFIKDQTPNKRQALIDRLLERDEFVDYLAMKWSELLRIKAEFPINLWPNAAQAYHRWVHDCIRQNMPYDRFVREMLAANGSNFRVGQVNFYRAVQSKDPQTLAQTVALTFMGARAEKWPKDRLAGMSAFFSQIGYKQTAEWKEEIVFFDPDKTAAEATNAVQQAAAVFPDGQKAQLTPGRDPRETFADWLITAKNPWFTCNIANRVWSWLLGRGIIQEPDDIRPDNPPVNPELLAYLETELVANHYNLKHLYKLILNSTTYQLSSIPKTKSPEADANFARYPLRRLEAEVLIDALNQITGTTEQYSSAIPEPFTFIPEDQRSITLPDGSISSAFLEMFGRSGRDTGLESESYTRITADQRLHLLNSSHIQRKIETSPKLAAIMGINPAGGGNFGGYGKNSKFAKNGKRGGGGNTPTAGNVTEKKPGEVVGSLYLVILSRLPTPEEFKTVADYFQITSAKREGGRDLAWALINSAEFLYRH